MSDDQDHTMRTILGRLEMLSHGTVQAFNAAGGADSERDPRPRGGTVNPPHDHYRARYASALTDHDRDKLIQQAQAELDATVKRHARRIKEETVVQFDARARHALAEGWTVQQVADHMRCTPTRIRRAQAGVDYAEARRLHAEGVTVRGIAMRLGIPKSTVHEALKRAA